MLKSSTFIFINILIVVLIHFAFMIIQALNDELETYKISIDSDIEQIRKEFTEHINYLQTQLNQYEQSSSIQTIDEGNIKEQINGQNNDSILSDPIGSGSIVTTNTYADSGVNTTPGSFPIA